MYAFLPTAVGKVYQAATVQPVHKNRRGSPFGGRCYVQPSTHNLLCQQSPYLWAWPYARYSCHRLALLIGRWCSMSSSEVALWWDRDADRAGRPIRPDVRASAHRIWGCASRKAQTAISDSSQAAELMEDTVAQVSRYLDRRCVIVFSREIDGLLMIAFQRALYRHVAKVKRLETVGGSRELSIRAVDRDWNHQVNARLELEQIVRMLSERSRTILTLRYAGYTWKESAKLLGASVPALRSAFWRDVARVKSKLKNPHAPAPEHQPQPQQDIATTTDPQC
jgi:DNA-directed RNA polymerase specialized sigma24 family protein